MTSLVYIFCYRLTKLFHFFVNTNKKILFFNFHLHLNIIYFFDLLCMHFLPNIAIFAHYYIYHKLKNFI